MVEGRPVSGSDVGGSATPQPPTVDNSESAAIIRALVELGLLLIRRRPITPPISRCPLSDQGSIPRLILCPPV